MDKILEELAELKMMDIWLKENDHRAEIEDMINDMQLVDPQYLQYYHMLQGTKDPSTSRLYEEEVKPKLKV